MSSFTLYRVEDFQVCSACTLRRLRQRYLFFDAILRMFGNRIRGLFDGTGRLAELNRYTDADLPDMCDNVYLMARYGRVTEPDGHTPGTVWEAL